MEITETVKITNRLGLHLRAAAAVAEASCKFKCVILFKNHQHQADGKSVINLLALAATKGTELTVTFQGEDALSARSVILNLFSRKIGEAS